MSASAFPVLARVLQKYRADVHQLAPAATADALGALEVHLGRRVPVGLRDFLSQHNGAALFRGALNLRSTSEISPASPQAEGVFVFADGPGEARWAFARLHDARHAFGLWHEGRLDPMHSTFRGWLNATIEVLDARVTRPEDVDAIRLEADPEDPYQLVAAAQRAMHAGRPEDARPLLDRATRADPGNPQAWQRLGDALAASDRTAARRAWLTALQQARVPIPWPGAPCLDADVLPALARSVPDVDAWERELERFLQERVAEVRLEVELSLVVAAALALSDSLVRRGRRRQARDVLVDLLGRSTLFRIGRTPWDATLRLAELEVDLGLHDDAESRIRLLRREGPKELQGPAGAIIGRLAVLREEPWAEEILDEALAATTDDDGRVSVVLTRAERALRQGRTEEAATWIDRARKLGERGAPRMLRAHTALLEGDLARQGKDAEAALSAYRRALDLLAHRPADELRSRVELRLGDLAAHAGRTDEAATHYARAARGFAEVELPVREAWALLRLARVTGNTQQLIPAARERFQAADLAAGVAVADAMARQPSFSLDWHIERTTEHARARTDAQRSRPPWTRADAERPERRIGAHRVAIAACGDDVVAALGQELDACARAIRAARGSPLDPPVLRYTAAVDLLAAHRSYAASQVLLRHLVDGVVDGPARRALTGAIARSPNAALVEGLLRCVERPGSLLPQAVAAAAEVLGLRREREAAAPLGHLAGPGLNPSIRRAAIVALGRIGLRDQVNAILPSLEEPTLAEKAALALLMLGDTRGVDFHVQALTEGRRDLSGHPGEIIGRYGSPHQLPVLMAAASAGEDDTALGALHGLGIMGDPRAVPALLRALDPRERNYTPNRGNTAAAALVLLTGHDEAPDDGSLHKRWVAWWEHNAANYPEGVRHRDGRLCDPGLFLERMRDADSWTRRTAYDELVITTGQSLPFDSDGPWRTQVAHLGAWQRWWARAAANMPAGHWYLDGRRIA